LLQLLVVLTPRLQPHWQFLHQLHRILQLLVLGLLRYQQHWSLPAAVLAVLVAADWALFVLIGCRHRLNHPMQLQWSR
jgi:hypothetical protein